MELYDLHCHLDLMTSMTSFAQEAEKVGIGILAVTTTPKAFEKEIEALRHFANTKVALGLHPQLVSERYNELSLVEKHIGGTGYIGEIGLDFNSQFYFSKKMQIDVFENIIKWCCLQSGKVISIHSVHADSMVLDILEKHKCNEKNKCILHWFSGSMIQLRRAIEMGCFFSVNGAMIKSLNGKKLITSIPAEKILIESDAPFINDIRDIRGLKIEIETIESILTSVFGINTLETIHYTSKELLSLA
jgi:TatD DNase family protein